MQSAECLQEERWLFLAMALHRGLHFVDADKSLPCVDEVGMRITLAAVTLCISTGTCVALSLMLVSLAHSTLIVRGVLRFFKTCTWFLQVVEKC